MRLTFSTPAGSRYACSRKLQPTSAKTLWAKSMTPRFDSRETDEIETSLHAATQPRRSCRRFRLPASAHCSLWTIASCIGCLPASTLSLPPTATSQTAVLDKAKHDAGQQFESELVPAIEGSSRSTVKKSATLPGVRVPSRRTNPDAWRRESSRNRIVSAADRSRPPYPVHRTLELLQPQVVFQLARVFQQDRSGSGCRCQRRFELPPASTGRRARCHPLPKVAFRRWTSANDRIRHRTNRSNLFSAHRWIP